MESDVGKIVFMFGKDHLQLKHMLICSSKNFEYALFVPLMNLMTVLEKSNGGECLIGMSIFE